MILTRPVSCVSDAFYLYLASFFRTYCNYYQPTNQIFLMMSLTINGLTPGPLVCVILLFALHNPLVVLMTTLVVLTIPLVVFMVWVLLFLFQWESSQLVVFVPI